MYPSKKYDHLTQIIELFLRENLADKKIDAWPRVCCLAVAGPVEKNIANITNLSWVLNGAQMSKTLGIPTVRIVNDFVGIGYGKTEDKPRGNADVS